MSIISFVRVIDSPVRITSASFRIVFFFLTTGIIKILLTITRNKKKKDDKIFMLAKNKLNSIETLISQALIDLQISHEEFKTIASEKEKYEKMKEGIRMMKSSDELNENNKSIRKIMEMRKIKIIIFFCIYKMLGISAKTWQKWHGSNCRVQ